MAIEGGLRHVGLAELEVLVLAHQGTRHRAVAVLHLRGRSEDRRIEGRNRLCGPDRHVELHIRKPERDAAETLRVRLVDAHAIAPWTDRLYVIVVLGKTELGIGE